MPVDVSFGSWWDIHAFAAAMAVLSRHIGAFAGVDGSSGRHVHSPAPFRRTAISPPSVVGKSITVASFEIERGAALIAFWTFHAVVRAGFFMVLFVVVVV